MMNLQKKLHKLLLLTVATFTMAFISVQAFAESTQELNNEANQALQMLYKTNPVAQEMGNKATAILVFPKIIKAGLVFGGAYGEGVLFNHGTEPEGYYNSVSGSWGWQAGAQSYGYVVFLMNDKAVRYLHKSEGWEIGTGPSVVVMNSGAGTNLTSTTLRKDAYAVIFDQQGLMVSLSIEGTKITRLKR